VNKLKTIYVRFLLWLLTPALDEFAKHQRAQAVEVVLVGELVRACVQEVIQRERRPGGVLYSFHEQDKR